MMSRHWPIATVIVALILVTGCGRAKLTKLEQAKQFLHKKDHPQALKLCDEMLAENPRDYDARLLRGQINESVDARDEAMADFTKAIEIDPAKPDGYAFRYKLNVELAAKATDAEREAYELAAIEDHRNYLRFSPSAAEVAGLSFKLPQPESLTKPIPGLEPSFEEPFELPAPGDGLADLDLPPGQAKDEMDVQALAGDGPQQEPPEKEPADQTAAKQWLAKRAESMRRIQEADLEDSGELTEPTLPPHADPIEPELIPPDVPPPLITRFDLPFNNEFRSTTPRKRRRSTGILQLPDDEIITAPDATAFRSPGTLPISPFLRAPSSAPSTGIKSGQPRRGEAARGWVDSRQSGFGTSITGLWAPWAPKPPQLGPPAPPTDEDAAPAQGAKSAQVLSMALPGTSVGGQPIELKLVPPPGQGTYSYPTRRTGFVTPNFSSDPSSASR